MIYSPKRKNVLSDIRTTYPMKLLTVVFSYNRYALLKNTVDSFYAFGPESDLLIMDDGSPDTRIHDFLSSCKKNARTSVWIKSAHVPAFHGSLYENMNRAVSMALSGGYTYIFFVQDDMQFMWKDDDFHQRIARFFLCYPDAAMLSPFFQKKISAHKHPDRFEKGVGGKEWHLKPYGICDVGVMPLSLFQKTQWKFQASAAENGRVWRSWGYKVYVPTAPTLAWVPWPQVRQYSSIFGREREPKHRYFLKPLSPEQIVRLRAIDCARLPYHEDFCFPWGWSCISPYWFTNLHREYFSLLLQGMLKGKCAPPHFVRA